MVMRVDVLTETIEKGIFVHYDDPKRNLLVIYTGQREINGAVRVQSV